MRRQVHTDDSLAALSDEVISHRHGAIEDTAVEFRRASQAFEGPEELGGPKQRAIGEA
jgi:hypothetical protein